MFCTVNTRPEPATLRAIAADEFEGTPPSSPEPDVPETNQVTATEIDNPESPEVAETPVAAPKPIVQESVERTFKPEVLSLAFQGSKKVTMLGM